MNKKLKKKIDNFLKERKRNEYGETTAVTEKEFEKLKSILDDIIEAKWAPDYSGCSSVEYLMVNRCTHEPINYLEVPHGYLAKTTEESMNHLRIVQVNARMANEKVDAAVTKLSLNYEKERNQNKETK